MTEAADLLQRSEDARRDGCQDEARRLAKEAMELCRVTADRGVLGDALSALGRLKRDDGHIDHAVQLYEEAAAIARETSDTLKLAHRLRHLGDIQQDEGRLDVARVHYDEALAIYRTRPDAPALDLANLLRPLALLEEKCGHKARAAQYWSEAGALYGEARVQPGVDESARQVARLEAS